MHTVETKAPISGMSSGKEIPAHMQFTYGQLPKKQGLEPTGRYGELQTEKNVEYPNDDSGLKGKAVWAGQIRKSEPETQIASMAVFNDKHELLFGKGNDSGKWVLPGGHMNDPEDPLKAAVREMLEETGKAPKEVWELGNDSCISEKGESLHVYCYACQVDGEATSKHDPDNECSEWKWVDVSNGLPKEIADNLHSDRNVTLELLGLTKSKMAKEEMYCSRCKDPLDKDGHCQVKAHWDALDGLEKTEGGLVFYHGTPSGDLRGGPNGLHVGSRAAAWDALNARIGVPAEGDWDGTREYGKTLLAGRKRLKSMGHYPTGLNCDAPEEDYYPTGKAKYGDGTLIPLTEKPALFPVRIVGPMTNTPQSAHSDSRANAIMRAQKTRGLARQGYYYANEGEGEHLGISAVVPSGNHLQRLAPLAKAQTPPTFPKLGHPEDKQPVLILNKPKEFQLRAKMLEHVAGEEYGEAKARKYGKDIRNRHVGGLASYPATMHGNKKVPTFAFVKADRLMPKGVQAKSSPTTQLGSEMHEQWHALIGKAGGDRKGIRTLAINMLYALPEHEREAVFTVGANMSPQANPDEYIAYLHTYLNDPAARPKSSAFRMPEALRQFETNLKRAHRHLQAIAGIADSSWVQGHKSWVKDE